MARKSDHVQLSFRIEPALHRKLKKAAEADRTTVNAQIKWRIERTFEQDLEQRQEEIVRDMENIWHRFAERFFELRLQEDILSALVEDNYGKAKVLAGEILRARAQQAHERGEKDRRDAAKIARWRAEQLAKDPGAGGAS
jgi:hypothetical protein